MLTTARLDLRAPAADDLPWILRHMNTRAAMRNLGGVRTLFRPETERVRLRSRRADDAAAFHAINSGPEVMATLGAVMSLDEASALIGRPELDFDHPRRAQDAPLLHHVTHELSRAGWMQR